MTDDTYDCAQRGHIWLENDGTVYSRHRNRSPGSTVHVTCHHCKATAALPAHSKNTAPPRKFAGYPAPPSARSVATSVAPARLEPDRDQA